LVICIIVKLGEPIIFQVFVQCGNLICGYRYDFTNIISNEDRKECIYIHVALLELIAIGLNESWINVVEDFIRAENFKLFNEEVNYEKHDIGIKLAKWSEILFEVIELWEEDLVDETFERFFIIKTVNLGKYLMCVLFLQQAVFGITVLEQSVSNSHNLAWMKVFVYFVSMFDEFDVI
jgi:hypothetical protein